MKKFISSVLALSAVSVMAFTGTAMAGSPGQLAQGTGLYQVKNLTQHGSYASSISAACGDEVQYSMQLSNTGFGALDNVTLTATLPSAGGVSNATATTDLGGTSGTHDSVTVTLGSGQTLAYESGTTVLYNDSATAIRTLPDGIAGGVNVGTINGSTTEYVNFRAKINCPTPPAPVCTDTNATNNGGPLPCQYAQPKPPTTPAKPAAKPAALPNTGPGEVAAVFTGASTLGAAVHAVTRRFRR